MTQSVYIIQLRGQIANEEVNEMSPLRLIREQGDTAVTQFTVNTDQSGLIGLMRHLHSRGYVILSVSNKA
jgi:hypothetical protein